MGDGRLSRAQIEVEDDAVAAGGLDVDEGLVDVGPALGELEVAGHGRREAVDEGLTHEGVVLEHDESSGHPTSHEWLARG